jgi:DHA1 family bicyclomycin/chloramphenicol resistance-like MFS transporter
MAVTGLFVDGTARPMLAGIAACALLAWFISWLTLRSARMRSAQV